MGAKTPPEPSPSLLQGQEKGAREPQSPVPGGLGVNSGSRRGDAAPAPSRGGCRVVPGSSNSQCPPVRALGTFGDAGCHHLGVPTPSPRAPRGTEGPSPSSRLGGCAPKTAPFLGQIPRFWGQCRARCRPVPLCTMQPGASLSRRITAPGTKPGGLCQPPSNCSSSPSRAKSVVNNTKTHLGETITRRGAVRKSSCRLPEDSPLCGSSQQPPPVEKK